MFVVANHRQAFREWFSEQDVTVEGPKRGLRHVLPVSLASGSPRSGRALGGAGRRAARGRSDRLLSQKCLRVCSSRLSRLSGAEIARRSGLPPRTAQRLACGSVTPSPATLGPGRGCRYRSGPRPLRSRRRVPPCGGRPWRRARSKSSPLVLGVMPQRCLPPRSWASRPAGAGQMPLATVLRRHRPRRRARASLWSRG